MGVGLEQVDQARLLLVGEQVGPGVLGEPGPVERVAGTAAVFHAIPKPSATRATVRR